MEIIVSTKNILDEPQECLVIEVNGSFKGEDTFKKLREVVDDILDTDNNVIYLDIRKATEIDLSACNEFIHSNYQLTQVNKELVLVYDKGHEAEEWISTAGLDRYFKLAITHE